MRSVKVIRTELYEVKVTGIEQPDFDYQASSSPRSRCTWRPLEVRLEWKRVGGEWVLITCNLFCGQVLKDGTMGRNGRTFSFMWQGPEAIPRPAYIVELENEHHPSKHD